MTSDLRISRHSTLHSYSESTMGRPYEAPNTTRVTLPSRTRRITSDYSVANSVVSKAFSRSNIHEPALGFEPTVDAAILASFRADLQPTSDFLLVRRKILTDKDLDDRYEVPERNMGFHFEQFRQFLNCDAERLRRIALSYVPIVETVKRYDFRTMLLIDLLCGITIGLVNISQGLTHGLLSNIYPIIGLYSSFYPILLYSIFGTSRILAFGTVSITSILVGNTVADVSSKYLPSGTIGNSSDQDTILQVHSDIAICISFLSGIIQMAAGILHLGVVTVYFSDAMVAGFTTATMIHVITSQAKNVLGLKILKATGNGNVIVTWIRIFENIGQTNLATLLISVVAAFLLVVSKFYVNPYVMRKIHAPLPMEAVVVIVSTLLSQILNFSGTYGVSVVGEMSNGLPAPALPKVMYLSDVLAGSVTCAIINYAVTVSLAQVLAKKNNEDVDANQECFAYGTCNFISSFFFCMPTGGSVSRSYIQDSMHCKSQFVGLVQSVIILIVLLFLSSFFSTLPQCILAVIIIVALTAIVEHFKYAWELWIVAPLDCIIWLVSFVTTVALDIQPGLIISILFSCFMVVVRGQLVNSAILGNITGTDLYRDVATYKKVKEIPGIKIFRFEGPIHYACASMFRSQLYRKTQLDPQSFRAEVNRNISEEQVPLVVSLQRTKQPMEIRFLILDLSVCSFVDYGGIRVLRQVIQEYHAMGVSVILASCPDKLRKNLKAAEFFNDSDPSLAYVSVHDAVTFAQSALLSERDYYQISRQNST